MTCRDIGGIYVDEEKRKEELIKIIENIKDADTIKYLHQTVDKVQQLLGFSTFRTVFLI